MKVKTKELLEAMKSCLPGIEARETILEGADSFVFSGSKIHSYNDHISVSVPIKTNIIGSVKAADFYKLVSKLPGEEFELTADEKSWKISCGNIKAEMVLLSYSVLEKINAIEIKDWKDLPEDFYDALKCCKMGCNGTPLAGIYVNGKNMFSTDNKRIHNFIMKSEMETFWVSDPSINELLKLGNVEKYSSGENWMNFQTNSGIRFSIRKMVHDRYPYTKLCDILEQHKKAEGDIDLSLPKSIFDALERAYILSGKTEEYFPISLLISNENIKVISEKISGKYEELLVWDEKKKDIPDLEMSVDYSHMRNALVRSLNFYVKKLDNGMFRIVFHSPNYRGVMQVINKEK